MLTDSKGNKLCPTHGKAFLLVPEQHKSYTGLCGHYDCIGKMISAMCNRSKLWKKRTILFHKLQIWEDFVAFIYEELLREAQQGKPTIINSFWFNFKMKKFCHRDLKKGFAVLSRVPSHYRPEHAVNALYVDDFEKAVIEREYAVFKQLQADSSPTIDLIFSREVNDYIEEYWGKEWVLFLNNELDRKDLAKLWGVSFVKIRRLEKLLYLNLTSEFCDTEHKQELMNSCGLDGLTPLKKIIVPAKVEHTNRGQGTTQRVDKSYWISLADSINESKGLTTKDKKKLLLIKEKEKELKKLKNSIRSKDYVEGLTDEEENTEEP